MRRAQQGEARTVLMNPIGFRIELNTESIWIQLMIEEPFHSPRPLICVDRNP